MNFVVSKIFRVLGRIGLKVFNQQCRFWIFAAIVGVVSVIAGIDPAAAIQAKWKTIMPSGFSYFGDPWAACDAQRVAYGGPGTEPTTIAGTGGFGHIRCGWRNWQQHGSPYPATPAPNFAIFTCLDDNGNELPNRTAQGPGVCKELSELAVPTCKVDNGSRFNLTAGNPVIIATGTKIETASDFSTSDGLLSVFRTYRSDHGYFKYATAPYKSLGRNWRLNNIWEIQLDSGFSYSDQFSIVAPDGAGYDYRFWSSGSISKQSYTPSGLEVSLISPTTFSKSGILNNGATFEVRNDKGEIITLELYRFGTEQYLSGRVTEIKQPSGNILTFAYADNANDLSTITDSSGKQLVFDWVRFPDPDETVDRARAIKSIGLPDGNTIHYTYDAISSATPPAEAYDRLVKVETKNSTSVVVDSVTYHYEKTGYPYFLTGITDHKNVRYATFTYDSQARVTKTVHDGGADETTFTYEKVGSEYLHKVTNALGKTTSYVFDRYLDTMRLSRIDGEASASCVGSQKSFTYSGFRVSSSTDEEGRVTAYIRDSEGHPTKITRASGTPQAHVTDITWSSVSNKPTQIKTPEKQTDYVYNSTGALTQMTETDTSSHTVPYSTNGQTRVWAITYIPQGKVATIDGPLPGTSDTITYAYDSNFDLASVTDELGHQTQILSVNGRGQPTQIQDSNGSITDLVYDVLGRLTSITEDPSGIAAQAMLEYDAIGQITKITKPDGSYLSYSYSDARRLTSVENNTGEKIEYTHNLLGNITLKQVKASDTTIVYSQQRTFDEMGRLLKTIGVDARIWTAAYNKVSEITSVTDPRGKTWTSGYDALGRLISETDPDSDQIATTYDNDNNLETYTDPLSIQTGFVHNGFGEVIQESSPDVGTTTYERDQRGLITKRTDARGIVKDYVYDAGGRLTSVTYPAATAENVALTHDATASGNKGVGRLTGIADQSGSTAYVYDMLGRVLSETRVIGSTSYATTYAYDNDGKISQIVYPSGRIIDYTRDANGQVTSVTHKPNSGWSAQNLAYEMTWTPYGALKYVHFENNVAQENYFTLDYNLIGYIVESYGPWQEVLKRDYDYADDLNITAIVDPLNTTNNQSYWYDNKNRLQNGDGPWGAYEFYYDASGNRQHRILTQGGTTTTQRFWMDEGTSNRLVSMDLNGTETRTFSHDAAGNMLTDVKSSVATAFTYNNAGRMSAVSIGGTAKGSYLYNANGQLVSRTMLNTTPSGTIHLIHDLNGNLIAEADGSGTVVREYVWVEHGKGGEGSQSGAATPVALFADLDTASPKLYYVASDHLSRPIMMTDDTKAIVWQATFLPFGAVHTITGSAANDNRFPGQYYQLESGLNYNWHRQYDPSLGRYTQPDPLGLIDGPSRYAYANSDPLQKVDPRGERRRGGRPPIPFTQYYNNYRYNDLLEQIREVNPNYTQATRHRFTPKPRHIRQLQRELRNLRQTRESNTCTFPTGGLQTPGRYFGNMTKPQAENILQSKFGSPYPGAPGGRSYYNPKTRRTFHTHQDPSHRGGKPHVDIRTRGIKGTKVFGFKE